MGVGDIAQLPRLRLDPDTRGTTTVREQLDRHRQDASCAACHAKIDPLGFAWDNYDAIGQWRTQEKVPAGVGADPSIQSAGEMPDGRAFKDSVAFKQLLVADRDAVAKAFEAKYPGIKVAVERTGAERLFNRIGQEVGSNIRHVAAGPIR